MCGIIGKIIVMFRRIHIDMRVILFFMVERVQRDPDPAAIHIDVGGDAVCLINGNAVIVACIKIARVNGKIDPVTYRKNVGTTLAVEGAGVDDRHRAVAKTYRRADGSCRLWHSHRPR